MFPASVVFALHDRRAPARAAGLAIALLIAASMLATWIGVILLASAALALAGTSWAAMRGTRRLGLDTAALPAIGGALLALGSGALIAPAAVSAWEAGLARVVAEAGEQAVGRYQALGIERTAVASLVELTDTMEAAFVAMWPALVAIPLWLGAWLGYRLLARGGRLAPSLARRIGRRSFDLFRLGEAAVWGVIAALAALWLPWEPARRAAINALAIAALLYGLQGLAVIVWWMNRRGIGTWVRLLLLGIGIVFLPPLLAAGTIGLGIAEHWLGLRERSPLAHP